MSTDTFTVDPIFFPGGDIGSLAVHGTVNDVAMLGARPKYMTCGFIIEEGLPMADLERIVESMGNAAREAGVLVVSGDTKVVPKGTVDKIFINTTGIGEIFVDRGPERAPGRARRRDPDQRLHGRPWPGHPVQARGPDLRGPVLSDCASLNHLIVRLLEAIPECMCCAIPPGAGWPRP
jgi:hydrogenase expression/formation protein HypE